MVSFYILFSLISDHFLSISFYPVIICNSAPLRAASYVVRIKYCMLPAFREGAVHVRIY